MRKEYQTAVGILKDDEYPSEVTSRHLGESERDGGEEFEIDWSRRGMKLKRQKLQGTLPLDTEGLRATFDITRHCHSLLRLRHGRRHALHGLRSEMLDNYVRFLLSKDVWGAKVRDASSAVVAELRWDQLQEMSGEAGERSKR